MNLSLIERRNGLRGRFGRLDVLKRQNRTLAAVELVPLIRNGKAHDVPLSVFRHFVCVAQREQTRKLDILHAAGHQLAAEEEHARLHARVHGCKALILDDLAVVLLRIFGKVTVPQRVIAVFNLYNRRVDVKRQRIFDLVVFDVAVRVLVGDVPGGG